MRQVYLAATGMNRGKTTFALTVAAAVLIEQCTRLNVSGCTILDCDGTGLRLEDVSLSQVSNCVIRDDRDTANPAPGFVANGGRNNQIVGNTFDRPPQINVPGAVVRENNVLVRPPR